ncbi:winged helix-turn-helix transcriptional regulator [Clostridium beijerinckii]|uniref:winged helix-turn-helix transcriptional regulator n=1 Tax=Clostridium beijerinckii TaxID=1520 RepID=UPI00047D1B5F|nr:helix-turn-helix domain-containing protein [Clostridium beijerinckii]
MYKHKLEKEIRCPLEYGIDIFGGKWKARIICILAEKGLLRYNEVRRELTDITDAVLSATLKELIADNIISRMQYNEIPPRVEYTLTEQGKTVIPILQSICRWSGAYHKSDNENVLTQCQKCDYNDNSSSHSTP